MIIFLKRNYSTYAYRFRKITDQEYPFHEILLDLILQKKIPIKEFNTKLANNHT